MIRGRRPIASHGSLLFALMLIMAATQAFRISVPPLAKAQDTHTRPSMFISALERVDRHFDTPWSRFMKKLGDDMSFRSPSYVLPPWHQDAFDLTTAPGSLRSIRVDVREDDNAYLIKADMPGVHKEDIKITCDRGNLVIQAERKEEKETKEGDEKKGEAQVHLREVSYGKVYRSFRLPGDADPDNIEASYDKGVLKITLPKIEAVEEKVIDIKGA